MRIGIAAGTLLAAGVLAAGAGAEPVTVERESRLHAEPRHDAPVVALLAAGSAAEALAKSGVWLQVKSAQGAGWLFSFNVRFQSAPPAAARPGAAGPSALGRLFAPRRTVAVTSTIGIRGLEEEDLRQARFDAAQLEQLERFAASRQTAEEHARATGLAPAKLDYLEASTQ